jgi:uncharacterized protein with NAD-binding domain and iron-sulfur cluster
MARRPTVLIIGGGVAGLSAAHELKLRGFAVTVLEREPTFGGKARSFAVPNNVPNKEITGLPAEHGFRFFPGFYKHLPHTLGTIPAAGRRGRTVLDDLITVEHAAYAQEGKPFFRLPTEGPRTPAGALQALRELFANPSLGLSPGEVAFTALKLAAAASMCDERREAELDGIAWSKYMCADQMSRAYRAAVVDGLTQNFVAMDADLSSTKSVINILVRLLSDYLTYGHSIDRILNGPTSEVWIDPWLRYLRSEADGEVAVKLESGKHVHSFKFDPDAGVITGVKLMHGPDPEPADYYIAAVPVEAMVKILERTAAATPEILEQSPSLKLLEQLKVNWMAGIMFYVKEDVPVFPGHVVYLNSPWALTSISQNQFWVKKVDEYGDARCAGVLSVIISDWFKGDGKGTPEADEAKTPGEIAEHTLKQLRAHFAKIKHIDVTDRNIAGYFIDPAIVFQKSLRGLMPVRDFLDYAEKSSPHDTPAYMAKAKEKPPSTVELWTKAIERNKEPLFINTVNSWSIRPTSTTGIGNLFLASDYVKTNTDLATMEGANEAARRAVNAILKAAGSDRPRCRIFQFDEPIIFAPFKAIDRRLFERGLPNPGFSAASCAGAALRVVRGPRRRRTH